MANLIMLPEHVSLIERKIKTQTRRLVKRENKRTLPGKYMVNWRYWICPKAKWKLFDNYFQDDAEVLEFTGEARITDIIGLRRCRYAKGAFKVKTIPTNETGNDFRLENLLSISNKDVRKEGYSSKRAFLKVFYGIYATKRMSVAKKSLKLIQETRKPFEKWFEQNKHNLWNPVVRVIQFRFLPNTERDSA